MTERTKKVSRSELQKNLVQLAILVVIGLPALYLSDNYVWARGVLAVLGLGYLVYWIVNRKPSKTAVTDEPTS